MSALIDSLITAAEQQQASDLFLSENAPARAKISGKLGSLSGDVVSKKDMQEFWQKCGANPDEDTDVDTSYVSPSEVRFRVSLFRHAGALGAVLRQIKMEIPGFGELGLPEELLSRWVQNVSGLMLVTGTTGSGKSTTLAACLEWVNQYSARHVVTIEDPIEFLFKNKHSLFTQREVGTDTVSFKRGLKSALRQAPDIIFLGEIRDAETATIALQAAETGHLVLATLHSSSVVDTLERITNLFPHEERESALMLLGSQLVGVISQQLLPREDVGMHLVVEHLENEGAVRGWIRQSKFGEIAEFIRRKDNPANKDFLTSLVDAATQGYVSVETARGAFGNAFEFNRAMRGIS